MLKTNKTVLVTGATGYVGGRLVPRLLERGYKVRVFVRSPQKLAARPWAEDENLEVIKGDIFDPESLKNAAKGCSTAYYLVHSMNPDHKDYAEADRIAAKNMVLAADSHELEQIIYLGGLGGLSEDSSLHLKSRAEVGLILQTAKTPVTWLRAAMIIGSGSASFEIMRYLVDRLPLMITPKWVRTDVQPIAVRDVLRYLVGCLENAETKERILDIGCNDILSYEELFQIYAEEANLPKRLILPVPVLTPTLSAYWINLVTPIPASIAMPLTKGLGNKVVVEQGNITQLIPGELMSAREAIRVALQRVEQEKVETFWTDAGSMVAPEWTISDDAPYAGGTILRFEASRTISQPIKNVWECIEAIGGEHGWYYANILWKIRGTIDKVFGGVGDKRGRRSKNTLHIGDALDFWRVLDIKTNERLLLLAEMKVPGEAVLEFKLKEINDGTTELVQSARFLPKGLIGIIYWYSLYPAHHWLFGGMLSAIAREAGKRGKE